MSSSENSTAEGPGRLISHFQTRYASDMSVQILKYQAEPRRTRDTQNLGWSDLWDTDQSDLWDRGKPSPALIDFVEEQRDILPVRHCGRPLRMLVPVRDLSKFPCHNWPMEILY